MVKILFCGNLNNEWEIFFAKLNTLHNSAHGPFDLLVCSGKFFLNELSFDEFVAKDYHIPCPIYFFDYGNILKDKTLPANLYLLSPVGTIIFNDLIIGSYLSNSDLLFPNEFEKFMNSRHHIRYDVLITSEWPYGLTNLLGENDLHHLSEIGYIPSNTAGSGQVIAEMVTTLRPRYHLSSSLENPIFYQRLPYLQSQTPYSSAFPSVPWFTRFIGLASVSSSKEKHLKWIHALSLDPISAPNTANTALMADLTQPHTACPYSLPSAVSVSADVETDRGNATAGFGSEQPPSKKLRMEDSFSALAAASSQSNSGSIFFGDMGVARQTQRSAAPPQRNTLLTPPSPHSKTLFFGGLPVPKFGKPVSFENDIRHQFEGVISYRQPSGKSFAFVEFESPENALKVIQISQETPPAGVMIHGHPVTVGWAADSNQSSSSRTSSSVTPYGPSGASSGSSSGMATATAMAPPPSLDCKTLYVGGLPLCDEPPGLPLDSSSSEPKLREDLKQLFSGCHDIRRIPQKSFAFLEFETHLQAAQAMLTYAQRSDAFQLTDATNQRRKLSLGWSKSESQSVSTSSGSGNGNGPQNNDCWFCLASPNVKTHLVVSVSDTMYLSLPRGGVTDFHVMIVPIDCLPSRPALKPDAKSDLLKYEMALEDMFTDLSLTSLRYERCIHPKSGSRNHLQVHVIPFALSHLSSALPAFHSVANKYHLQFHPIPDSIELEDFLSPPSDTKPYGITGGPYEEYFYIEIPVPSSTPTSGSGDSSGSGAAGVVTRKRFVFAKEGGGGQFPMHLGLEIAANAIQRPDRANWKNCQQSEEEETELAEKFRKAFERFDFT